MSPIDSCSLGIFIHKYGLNIRYLGAITEQLENAKLSSYSLIARRTMLVRCLKHFLSKVMRETDLVQLPITIVHILNCILGSKPVC